MVLKEYYKTRKDDVILYRTYSDKGLCIKKKGTEEIYHEAIDVESVNFMYEETDIPIEKGDKK